MLELPQATAPPPPPPPPAAPAAPTEPQGFDVNADVAALKSRPKQDYSQEWKETEPAKASDVPGADAPGAVTGDKPTDAPAGEGQNSKEAAREFIECYDIVQCQGFSIYSDGMPAEKFALEKFPKERAIHHLAKGLEKMGSPEVPWWLGLVLALTPPAFVNFMAAKENRAATAEAARAKAKAGRTEHAAPRAQQPARTAPAADAPAAHMEVVRNTATTERPANTALPLCAECGINHVKSRKKKYCSQSCAGKATSKKRHTTAPAAPTA